MKTELRLLVFLAVALTVQLVGGTARGDEPQEQGAAAAGDKGGAVGAMTVEATTTTSTVTALDPGKRTVTLRRADGSEVTLTCGPEVRNFDQIKIGDQVKATVTQSLAVYARKPGEAPPAGERQTIALAAKGAMPGAMVANTTVVTAKIAAIDRESRLVALQDKDGQYHTIHVGPNIDLAAVHPGDDVVFRYTERALIRVERGTASEGGEQTAASKIRGAIVAEQITTDATITALDKDQRTITLKRPDGAEQTFKATKGVDLDKLNVGDEVKAKLVEAMAIGVRRPDAPAPEGEAAQATLSAGGEAEPVMADTMQETVKIKAIDTDEREVTLQTPDGQTHIIHAGPRVDLNGLKAGDDVVVRRTQGVAILVEKAS